jgi:hypothetical protein
MSKIIQAAFSDSGDTAGSQLPDELTALRALVEGTGGDHW